MRLRCPHCQRTLEIPDHAAGKQVRCPACSQTTRAPEAEEPPSAEPPRGSLYASPPPSSPLAASAPAAPSEPSRSAEVSQPGEPPPAQSDVQESAGQQSIAREADASGEAGAEVDTGATGGATAAGYDASAGQQTGAAWGAAGTSPQAAFPRCTCPRCARSLLVTADLAEQVVACPACHLHLRMPSVAEASRGVAATRVAGLSGRGMPTMERGPSTFPSAANPYVSPVGGGGGPAGLAFQAHSEPILYILPGAIQLTLAVLGLFVSLGSLAFGLLEEGPPNNSDEVFTLLFQTVSLVTTGVIIAGSIQMIRRRSLGLARAAAILAILPCNVCCVMLMPFGIWSTVMLFLPNAPRDFQ